MFGRPLTVSGRDGKLMVLSFLKGGGCRQWQRRPPPLAFLPNRNNPHTHSRPRAPGEAVGRDNGSDKIGRMERQGCRLGKRQPAVNGRPGDSSLRREGLPLQPALGALERSVNVVVARIAGAGVRLGEGQLVVDVGML